MRVRPKVREISHRQIERRRAPRLQSSKIDTWLSRISSVSQAAVVLLTAAGFWFTVLPLYQKALLEEAIARKELEYKEVAAAMDRVYGRLRYAAVKDFVFYAGSNCSGLLLPPPTLYLIGQSSPDKRPHAQQILEIGARDCLVGSLEKYRGLADLRPEDAKALRTRVESTGERLDQKRLLLVELSSKGWESPSSWANAQEYSDLVRAELGLLRDVQWAESK